MLSVAEAVTAIRSASPRLPSAAEPLGPELAGRVLTADVVAAVSLPPFTTSAMDGYAVRAADLGGPPVPIAFRVAAGDPPRDLEPGTCAGIATGAPVPGGADAVVPIEHAGERDGGLVADQPAVGANLRPAGGDVSAGQVVAHAGATLGPALLAAIASAGTATIDVSASPRIAILVTGSELALPGRPLAPGQIYESNGTALAAQADRAGAEVVSSVIVPDDRAATERAFAHAIEGADMVVSSGGVSVGPHDHVKPALDSLGVQEVFWRVTHKPGKPLWFGVAPSGTLIFGLPGNPVSSLVCFELFVRQALEQMTGALPRPRLVARLAEPVRRLAERDHAVRCRLAAGPEGELLHPQTDQDSHLIAHAAAADAVALVAAGEGEAAAGELVEYVPI
jgi:molybdopterin molybdotransferase